MNYVYISKSKVEALVSKTSLLENFMHGFGDLSFKLPALLEFNYKPGGNRVDNPTREGLLRLEKSLKRHLGLDSIRQNRVDSIFALSFDGVYTDEFGGFALFLGKTQEGDKIILFGSESNLTYESLPADSHKVGGSFVHTIRPKILEFLKERHLIDPNYHVGEWRPDVDIEGSLSQMHSFLFDERVATRMEAIIPPSYIFERQKYVNEQGSVYVLLASPVAVAYVGVW
ncbi:hypothetical protein E5F05_16245 [Deinococcus metallilatus]|uniref:Uncharacterized protein n=1 Tax=Deinococcus metallilatus TaxID=1211322 RepID=A0AAJ5K5L7_9DEIO|nr:hypothetical protein [Deinococcus metallilatus]MBB5294943.1 hypothetical protein [Deinococcus metallilatus]QBY09356.1 hypothetical protein E5F05_16245 [Deinococcus metallilatus]RXJ09361.1 hypothetical protein ERJ73_15080 [Deinococcus metallilatus]TLK28883.1 hypothetical protein FCS05_06845 [Deinococcus metallilatus]GMA16874.1 hypothetical protein GCM10025871_32050 [Deinococcus metallilatus]